jgi:hypothetical protein
LSKEELREKLIVALTTPDASKLNSFYYDFFTKTVNKEKLVESAAASTNVLFNIICVAAYQLIFISC